MRPASFRARLALTMSALILIISSAIWLYVPAQLEREAVRLIANKADTVAHLTAFTIHPAVFFQDRSALEEALSGTRQDRDVAYVIVQDPAGHRLAAFHPELAGHSSGSLYEVMTPITDGGREIARLYIGMSLARVNREIMRMRVGIGLLSLFILAAGLIAVVLISNLMTGPLRDLAAGASRIAAGELSQRVPVRTLDEIGRVAADFNEMAAKVAQRDAAVRDLSRRMLSAQEGERVRIAREVHDELGQALTALKIDLQQAADVRSVSRTIDGIIELVRRIASDLRPAILDDLGIVAALEQQLRRLRETTGIRTTLNVSVEPDLDMLASVTLYRIAQEAIANVVRHAEATEVEVSLATGDGNAVLSIRDNGRGMTMDQGLGLTGMRERAELVGGTVSITSTHGTTVKVTLPC